MPQFAEDTIDRVQDHGWKMARIIVARKSFLASASVRVLGSLLGAVGIVVGVRVLGAQQFGISVMVLSVGQLLAFPLTAMERLVIRLVAHGDDAAAAGLLMSSNRYCYALSATGIASAAVVAWQMGADDALFVLGCVVVAVSAGVVTIRQGAARASGRLGWGQVPNEIVRPVATMAGYPLANWIFGFAPGVLAAVFASVVTLVTIFFGPRVVPRIPRARKQSSPGLGSAAGHLMVVSAVALAVERVYPLVLGWRAGAAAVAVFAVVVRVAQFANFSQAFAIFFYSPAIAASLQDRKEQGVLVGRLTKRIRWLGLMTAAPVAALCLLAPRMVEKVVGGGLHLEAELRFVAIAILALAIGGPAQTLLVMAREEARVARAYLVGAVASAGFFFLAGGASALAATLGYGTAALAWSLLLIVRSRTILGRW